ncbi:MAG TPA: molybdopterin oxidoreductase family protein [Methylomirabilota bacterium]|nr:molybdopterin oxidoreductase family protein [Methylomirabilota bacterium]
MTELLRRRDGPLTRDLVLEPGRFGLGRVPARLQPDDAVEMVCGYCSTGCSLKVHLRQGEAINLTPAPDYPVNLGMACPKGWEALTPLRAPDRATVPLRRNAAGKPEPVDWETALRTFCGRFKELLDRHGPEAVAFLSTGQIVTEEMAFLGVLTRCGLGIEHGDSNTRQCMATSAVAYKQSFGFDAPPYTYADFEASDVLVFVGSNLCIAHPILWQRVLRNPHSPEIIVIDPRRTETAMAATQHLALAPKSDLVLFYGTARALIELGAVDRAFVKAHTTGFDEFARFVQPFTPERVCAETRLSRETFDRFVGSVARGRRVSFWWTMGVNQGHESTRTAQAIINLALMTGNIGRPGTGPNSITGQCNAMGSRLFANITSLVGGHDFADPGQRQKVAAALDLPETRLPRQPCHAYDQILQGIDEGRVKGLWMIATNTAHSWIDQAEARRRLSRLEFLVVQDMYHSTDSARLAHLVLPAAGWGEKTGTFINSERRLGLVKKVARAPGQALSDFRIFQLIAHHWGCGEMFRAWSSPEAVFDLLRRVSRGQPCDISGIRDYAHLEACGGVQWPHALPADGGDPRCEAPARERRLFADGRFFTPDQRARFLFAPPRPMPEPTDAEYPLLLLTGRGSSAQWHTQTRTGKSDVLRKLHAPDAYAEINPADARRLGIADQKPMVIRSRRGTVRALAVVTPTVQPGHLFMPMHYAETNVLTRAEFDPYSRQPSYKACAVSARPA